MAWRAADRAELRANAENADNPGGAGYHLEEQVGHLLRRAHQRHTAIF